jgi:hypothetical protein
MPLPRERWRLLDPERGMGFQIERSSTRFLRVSEFPAGTMAPVVRSTSVRAR